ncbi:MAG: transcriptional repressor [Chloroflexota bacterium]|nr:transcriptional repressor [Chloroflexota bacterium]
MIKIHAQHMTAEAIHAAIVPVQPYIDIATVYRTLQWLQRVGLVAPISTGEGKQQYEYRRPGEYHHHLVRQQCGQHIEIPDSHMLALKADLQRCYGFTLDADHLALSGRCAICAAVDTLHE